MELLRWEHQWGGISKEWQERFIAAGRAPDESFFKRPELDALEMALHAAFYDLSTERQIGMAIGPIPRSKMRAYASSELQLSADEADWFCGVLSRIDGQYLSMIRPKNKDEPKMRDSAPPNDPAGTRRILKNLAKKPEAKPAKPNA